MNSRPRAVLHVDLDAFFVAVERVLDPRLRGRPVAVGGAPGERGVVASASYEARAYGVRSAMPMAQALRLCPNLVRVPARHALYERASHAVFRLLGRYTPVVEQVSIDEGYLDLTGTECLFGRAVDVAARLRAEVAERLRLDLTVGVAANRLVSKVASDRAKPCGLLDVAAGQEAPFLAPLPVRALPGVGPVTERRLLDCNIETLRTLAATEEWFLEAAFGSYGPQLRAHARGEDDTPVCPPWELPEAKSIGHEQTFVSDTADHAFLRGKLAELLAAAAQQLRGQGLLARTVTVRLRYADFVAAGRDHTLASATDHDGEFLEPALELLQRLATRRTLVRRLGVRLSGLQRGLWQGKLWDGERMRERRLLAAVDHLRRRHHSLVLASGLAVWLHAPEKPPEAVGATP